MPYAASLPGGDITVAEGLAPPSLSLVASVNGNTVTFTPTVAGNLDPALVLLSLTVNGANVLGDQTGTGPWSYVALASALALFVDATVLATKGVSPNAQASATRIGAAPPAAMDAPTATVLSASAIRFVLMDDPDDGESPIQSRALSYTVNGGPAVEITGLVAGATVEVDDLDPGDVVVARSRAVNAVDPGPLGAPVTASTWELPDAPTGRDAGRRYRRGDLYLARRRTRSERPSARRGAVAHSQ